ncbi:MAG: CAP domain-containing protein [Pleurocapsa minor HA4230-MV1]|jgi:uncharacterized protein YkwD|nr:CAP domain-containing protein [Pleurocapsa minor HA4230-MV1]
MQDYHAYSDQRSAASPTDNGERYRSESTDSNNNQFGLYSAGEGGNLLNSSLFDGTVLHQSDKARTEEIPVSDTFDRQILELVNKERAKVGIDPLQLNEQLDRAADLHAQDQANTDTLSHTGSNGSNFDERILDAGYQYSTIGENVAVGYADAETVVTGWMGSDGHRENILNPAFEELGVGYSVGDNGSAYWTQSFGTDINGPIMA